MNKNKLFINSCIFFIMLFPLFTIINFIFYYNNNYIIDKYCYIININLCGIDWMLIKSNYAYLFWRIFAVFVMSIKILLFITLPIIAYRKRKKSLYVVQFAIIFLDLFCIIGGIPTDNYIIIMLNILYHLFTLVILGISIKCMSET